MFKWYNLKMLSRDRNKLNRIEELKSKLFDRDFKVKIEHRDSFPHFEQREVMDSWEDKEEIVDFKEKFFMKTSMFKKFFIFSIIFFILAVGYAVYVFFANSNSVSNENIDINIQSNAFTSGGEDYPLLLEIINRNSSPILLADLVVEYPKSSQSTLSNDNEHLRLSLGTIPAGGVKNENIKFVLYGEQGSIRPIKISLEYRVEGSNAIFVKEKDYEVSINSTPINLSIDAPTEANSNQDLTLGVKATLNSTKSVSKMLLKIDYPIGFQFSKAIPAPSMGNNVWDLGDLSPGAERDISISGKMVDVFDGEEKVFRVWSGTQSKGDKSAIDVVFNSAEQIIAIKKSSLQTDLLVNGISSSEYAVDTKTSIQGQIRWTNNLETKINDLKIVAKISGNAFDPKSISSRDGFYDSNQGAIIWDKNSIKDFAEINPGSSDSVSFSISPLPLFSAASGMKVSPAIYIDITTSGRQSQGADLASDLSSKESKVIKIISDLGLSTKALYYSGAFQNTGSIPPKVGKSTTYTIVWSISNTANNISKAQVTSSLPTWIRFVGVVSPLLEDLTYNPSNREIIWNAGGVPKGTGITTGDKTVSFQVELIPSLSQLNTAPTLINSTTLTGHDDFANVDIKVNKTALDTRLLGDPDFPFNGSKVVE